MTDGVKWCIVSRGPGPCPVGALVPTATAAAGLLPWALPCDGSAYRKDEYPELYATLCVRPRRSWWKRLTRRPLVCVFGEDGEWFNVPDLRGRVTTVGVT